ncbi:MAG: hypothetical protein GZ091_08205, partial [Paludibacter sp.]|nr:hypothetical protein [Paludibacter sp.]
MKKLLFTFMAVCVSAALFAATITSNAVTGNWNDPLTWAGGVPTSADDVILVAGSIITLTADADCKTITFPKTGSGNATITLAGFTLTTTGSISLGNTTTDLLDVGTGVVNCGGLTINGTTSKISTVDISSGTVTVNGQMDMANNNSPETKMLNVGVGGTLVLNGPVTTNKGAVYFNASSTVKYIYNGDQNMFSRETPFDGVYGNLVVGGGGVKAPSFGNTSTEMTVQGTLTMDGAIIKLESKRLQINDGGNIVPGASNPYSVTNMIQTIKSSGGTGSLIFKSNTASAFQTTYPVGTETAYSPLVISNLGADVATGAYITVKAIAGKPFVSSTDYINCQWSINTSGFTTTSGLAGYLGYADTDITGTESNINTTGVYNSSSWTTGGSVTTANNRINLFGTNLNGQWTAASTGSFTAPPAGTRYSVADGVWNSNNTWNGSTQPLATDNVVILNNVNIKEALRTCNNLTIASSGRLYDDNKGTAFLNINGSFDIQGIYYDQNGSGNNIFVGKVTVYPSGNWSSWSNNNGISQEFKGGLENNGTFSTGNANFSVSQDLAGTNPIPFTHPIVIPAGVTLTNKGYVKTANTINGTAGDSKWINAANSTLEYYPNSDTDVPMSTQGVFDATAEGNTVKYVRTSKQYVKNTNYWHLSIGGGNTKKLSTNNDSFSINGDLTIDNGTILTLNDVAATNTITVGGNVNNSGTLTLRPAADRYSDVVLAGNSDNIGAGSCNNLTINAGKKGTLASGTFAVYGNLLLKSDAPNGTATFWDNGGTLNVTGTATVEQYLGTTRNWYVSSPVNTALAPAGFTYYKYDEPGNNAHDPLGTNESAYWENVATNASFAMGTGYVALPSAELATLSFTSTAGSTSTKLNTGNTNITLSMQDAGFNLIGNPYPSNLTWNTAFVTANASKVEPTIWYRTKTGNYDSNTGGGWAFYTFNATSGISV